MYARGVTAPRLYLVCGLPGAGKTTRSRKILAEDVLLKLGHKFERPTEEEAGSFDRYVGPNDTY
jgi:hypothetical protein